MFIYYLSLLDQSCFLLLNKLLLSHKLVQYFIGILVHRHESWLNVIVMFSLNIIAILALSKNNSKLNALKLVLYCWLSFQIIILFNNFIFNKILIINRDSPSIVLSGAVQLSQLLNNNNLKDYSSNSFPAGHALVLIYWLLFLNLYAKKNIKIIAITIAILLTIARMITGAHWLTDTLAALLLGFGYFKLSIWLLQKYGRDRIRIKDSLH